MRGLSRFLSLILLLVPVALNAQSYRKLPDWAIATYEASRKDPQPEEADDWVLLDRTEFAYTGSGELAVHRFLLTEVLTDRGADAGVFVIAGLGGGASKVKKLKGWNLRPDGDLVKLDSDDVVVIDKPGDSNGVTNERLTGVGLGRVVRGSVVAFESIQTETNPLGPYDITGVMGSAPIFRWELSAAAKGGWFTNLKQVSLRLQAVHFSPWIPAPAIVPGASISADHVPALPRGEGSTPDGWNVLPRVEVEFVDPDLKGVPDAASWDGVAAWEEGVFVAKASPRAIADLSGSSGLEAIHKWMAAQLLYKQVYLAPDRGWTPLSADQVLRRRYGDCKDLAACFIAAARAAGFEAFPVLARIGEGRIEANEAITPFCFNHVIAAVRLKETLHLPAEVQTPAGRFLLVDATARMTPFGLLPAGHAKGRLMICTGGKGIWVDVPDAALERPELHAVFLADVEATGRVQGTLKLTESANAWGLRNGALTLDPSDYQRFIFADLLALPSNASIQVLNHSDPLDAAKPFEVEVSIQNPKGLEIHGSEWDLDAMGIFRMVPPAIQRAGRSRRYPVEFRGQQRFDVRAEITLPGDFRPILGHRAGGSAFHTYQWDATSKPKAGGKTTLSIEFRNEDKWAEFGFETRDTGVAEWAKDRHQMQSLISDGLAFESKP